MDRWILTADKALCGRELDLIENVSIIDVYKRQFQELLPQLLQR